MAIQNRYNSGMEGLRASQALPNRTNIHFPVRQGRDSRFSGEDMPGSKSPRQEEHSRTIQEYLKSVAIGASIGADLAKNHRKPAKQQPWPKLSFIRNSPIQNARSTKWKE